MNVFYFKNISIKFAYNTPFMLFNKSAFFCFISIDLFLYFNILLIIIILMIKLSIVLLIFIALSQSQHIVDYSHTDHLQKTSSYNTNNYNINIHPSKQKAEYLQFPQSCNLSNELQVSSLIQQFQNQLSDQQQKLQQFKASMTKFLKLSQIIQQSKYFLKQALLQNNFQQDELWTPISQNFQQLQNMQINLKNIKQGIIQKVQNLSVLIIHELNQNDQNSFAQIELQFQKRIYLSRLTYLSQLKQQIKDQQRKQKSRLQTEIFFEDIQESIRRQKRQIIAITQLISNFSNSNELKLKISNLQSQLQGLNLMISQKQSCDAKRAQFLHRQNKKQLDRIYDQLKQLKTRQNLNRQYCQGVAASLVKQLKKLLKVYNYSFACSQGLPDLKNRRLIIIIQLQRLKKQFNDIDYDNRSQKIRAFFKNQQSLRQRFINEINRFKLSDYSMDIKIIDQQISTTTSILQQIQYKLKHPPDSHNRRIDYPTIRQMIGQIQRQQYHFCSVRQKYQQKYRTYDIILRSYQHKTQLKIAKRKLYITKVNQLRQLQHQFQETRNSLLQILQ